MKIILSNRAAADLLQIYRYVAERNPAAAEAIIAEIDRKFEHLRDFPLIGRDRSSLRHRIRSIVAYRYSIFYEVFSDRIMIVRVLDGRRDIDAEFQR